MRTPKEICAATCEDGCIVIEYTDGTKEYITNVAATGPDFLVYYEGNNPIKITSYCIKEGVEIDWEALSAELKAKLFNGPIVNPPAAVGIDVQWMCRISDKKKVLIGFCKLEDQSIVIKDLDLNVDIADLSGYEDCTPEVNKSLLESYYGTLDSATGVTYTPTAPLDSISVAMIDESQCHFVRATFICPDGPLGCFLLNPNQPSKDVSLPKESEITSILLEVVELSAGTDIKSWPVIAPTVPIDISIDGLDIN